MVNKKKYNVFISGGNGFVGRYLCKYLEKRDVSVIIGNDPANQVRTLDVTNMYELLSMDHPIEAIIHLASRTSITDSLTSPRDTFHTNLLGTLNLLEFARQKKIAKFINISTYVYGQPRYLPIDEIHPIDPHSPYNVSKLLAEQLCEYYSRDFELNVVTLRPFSIYGPCPRPNSFFYNILDQIFRKNGKVLLSGKCTKRDFLFVKDFCRLIEIILDNFPTNYRVYNVGCGKSYLLVEVALVLARLLDKTICIDYDNQMRPGDPTDTVADISKVSKEFDWKPSTSLESGLNSILKQYRYTP